MFEKEPNTSGTAWVRRHALDLAGTITFASITAGAVAYEVHRRRVRNAEALLKNSEVFELDSEQPSRRAQHLQELAARSLTHQEGASWDELRKQANGPGIGGNHLRTLIHSQVVRVEQASGRIYPHQRFVDAVVETPDLWAPVITRAQGYDPTFTIEALREEQATDDL